MSHDNWERLVRAVIRDEENRRIALWSSMESISYISSASSSFRASSTYNSPIINGSFSFSPTFEFPAVSPNDHETMAISEPQKVVLKLDIHDEKGKQKAMRAVSRFSVVESISMDMKDKKLTIVGDIDPVQIVNKLRKLWATHILTVGPAKEPDKKKEEEEKKKRG